MSLMGQRTFTLQRQGDIGVEPLSIEKGNYGVIGLAGPNLLVVIDGVLQTPSIDYSFNGGTQITFSEAPKSDYSCQIFFYKGSQNDTSFIDVDPPLEIGDKTRTFYSNRRFSYRKAGSKNNCWN